MKTVERQVMELFKAMQDTRWKANEDLASSINRMERQVYDLLRAHGVPISEDAIAAAFKDVYPPSPFGSY